MNHTGISSGCTTCHNGQAFAGVTPVSKPANHIATTADCVSCHTSFVSFAGGTFNHAGITSGCASCHTGAGGVVGKPANHIPTTQDCSTCHRSTTAFGPATPMNHTGISSGCTTCHNGQAFSGVTPVSKPANHIATTADCVSCHTSFVSFAGGTFNHAGITSGCASCHTGAGGVVGKPANHIPTSQDCSTCHRSTTAFGPATPMNHTGISSGCTTCHNGQAFSGVTPVSKPANHIATTADCVSCHTSFVSFAGGMFNHAGVAAGTCNTCHTGTGGGMVQPARHVPTGTVSCDTCHRSKAVGGFATFTMGNTGHTALGRQPFELQLHDLSRWNLLWASPDSDPIQDSTAPMRRLPISAALATRALHRARGANGAADEHQMRNNQSGSLPEQDYAAAADAPLSC